MAAILMRKLVPSLWKRVSQDQAEALRHSLQERSVDGMPCNGSQTTDKVVHGAVLVVWCCLAILLALGLESPGVDLD
jgi:hypothetical protein